MSVGTRTTFRHGDLRAALLRAGIELASSGGPDAVVLREATRRAGVVPNAAYRHFADRAALLEAVSNVAQGYVADAMEEALAASPEPSSPQAAARARLRAVGTGYLTFACRSPGLFRAAFSVPAALTGKDDAEKAGRGGRTPFQLLTEALDALVEAGVMPEANRPGAEFLAWSAVHGLAMLAIDGPLREMPDEVTSRLGQRVIDMVEHGFEVPPRGSPAPHP